MFETKLYARDEHLALEEAEKLSLQSLYEKTSLAK